MYSLNDIIHTYTRFCGFPLTKDFIHIAMASSPYSTSLLSIVKILKFIGLEVYCATMNIENLMEVKSYFLLHLNIVEKNRMIIGYIDNGTLVFYDGWGDKLDTSFNSSVLSSWDGIVIYQLTPNSPNRTDWYNPFLWLFCPLIICLLTVSCFIYGFVYLCIGLGVVISFLFIAQDFSKLRPSIMKLYCPQTELVNCPRVKSSKYASIFNIKLADLSFSYFVAQAVTILILDLLSKSAYTSIWELMMISIFLFLPISAYSIYAQFRLRTICILCISILFILGLESVIALIEIKEIDYGGLVLSMTVMLFFLLLVLISIYIYRYLHKCQYEKSITRIKMLRLLRNRQIFRQIVGQPNPDIQQIPSKKINKECSSSHTLKLFISPSCYYCKRALKEIRSILNKNPNVFNFEICDVTKVDCLPDLFSRYGIFKFPTIFLNNREIPLAYVNIEDIQFLLIDEELFEEL